MTDPVDSETYVPCQHPYKGYPPLCGEPARFLVDPQYAWPPGSYFPVCPIHSGGRAILRRLSPEDVLQWTVREVLGS